VTLFRSSVEAWRPLVTQYANGKPIEFLLAWLDRESGGYPCDYTYLGEAGIGQLDPNNMASVGTNVDEQHPTGPCPSISLGCVKGGPCPASSHAIGYNDLTDQQRIWQVVPWLDYVDQQIDRARTDLAQYGYTWSEESTSFWSMVKWGHIAPAYIPRILAQGIICNGGVPPADYDALMACNPNLPANWVDNGRKVGSYATGFKWFGMIPTWFAVTLGIAGFFGLFLTAKYVKRRYPRTWAKLHLPEKVPLPFNGLGLAPKDWFYDYDEGHFHHIVNVTPKAVTYDVIDDGITVVRRTKPRSKADRAIKTGSWISVER
jgi:hypothetical protein